MYLRKEPSNIYCLFVGENDGFQHAWRALWKRVTNIVEHSSNSFLILNKNGLIAIGLCAERS